MVTRRPVYPPGQSTFASQERMTPSGSVATPRQTRQSQANRRREQGARHGPLLDSTVPAPPLTIKVGPLFRLRGRQPFADPAVDLLLEDGQRQGAVQEDGVVEVA